MTRVGSALSLLVVLGCNTSEGTNHSAPGVGTVSVLSRVTETRLGHYDQEPPLAGVEVCVDANEPRNCAETGEDGRFMLGGLEPESEVLLVYSKEGFRPTLQPIVTPRWSTRFGAIGNIRMAPPSLWDAPVEALNVELQAAGRNPVVLDWDTRGCIIWGTREADGRATTSDHLAVLDPPSGDGPFFGIWADEDLAPEVEAPAESAWGVYFNVEPRDDYEFVFTRKGAHCMWSPGALSGWKAKSGRENTSATVVRAGHSTWWTVQECPRDPDDAGTDDAGVP